MQLPAELRLKILRFLLRSAVPIYNLDDRSAKTQHEYVELHQKLEAQTKLSAQLLRVCQQLHHEGLPILYSENVLEITWSDASLSARAHCDDCYLCNILTYQIHYAVYCGKDPFWDELEVLTTREYPFGHSDTRDSLVAAYPTIGRFQKFHVIVDVDDSHDIFYACRALRGLLHNKIVQLRFDTANGFDQEHLHYIEPYLHCLRCEDIMVDCRLTNDWTPTRGIITSKTDFIDTWASWMNFSEHIVGNLQEIEEKPFRNQYKKLYERTREAASTYANEDYEKHKVTLLEKAQAWTEEWYASEVAQLDARKMDMMQVLAEAASE